MAVAHIMSTDNQRTGQRRLKMRLQQTVEKIKLAHQSGAGFHLSEEEMSAILEAIENSEKLRSAANRFIDFFITDYDPPKLIIPEMITEEGEVQINNFTQALLSLSDALSFDRLAAQGNGD